MSNLSRWLAEALDGSPCQVFHDGMKLQVACLDEAVPIGAVCAGV